MSTPDLPPLREVIAKHGIAAKKSLGQNFLLDLNLTRRIARAAGDLARLTIIEVGPGPGGLTRALLDEGARRVVALERDVRCLEALAEIAEHYPGRLRIIEGDALATNFRALADGPTAIAANLPYNIGTPLLVAWLSAEPWPPFYESMTLMFQKEVAERIAAAPGSRSYGRLSVLAQWRCETKLLFDINPRAFTPPPKVTSSVVQLTPRERVLAADLPRLGRVTAAAFGQRRKMLRQSLKALTPDPAALLAEAGIDPTLRAEDVDVPGFVRLTNAWTSSPHT